MKKKSGYLTVAAVIFATLLAGCSSTKSTESNISSEKAGGSDKLTKITYCTWNENQKDSIQATINGFQKVNPNIKVEIQITPWAEYWTKLEAAATSGNMPDIVTMHTNQIEKYVDGGMLSELDDLTQYDETFSYDNYDAGITNLYTYDGKHYGVPKDKDCVVLVYNKKLFDNAKVDYPTSDWSWNEMESAAEKLTDKEKGIYGFNAYNNEQEGWGNFLYQNGGSIIDEEENLSGLDNPKSIEAMEYYMNLNDKYSPSKEMQAETDPVTLFSTGNIAMQPIGNWQLSYFTDNEVVKDDFEIVSLPAGPAGEKASISNGLALSIPKDCKNADAARKFLTYAGSEQGMKDAASGPAIPCFNGVDNIWAEAHKELYDAKVILEGMKNGVQLRGSELKTQWGESMYDSVGKIFDGEMSVADAFKQASEGMNVILAKENK